MGVLLWCPVIADVLVQCVRVVQLNCVKVQCMACCVKACCAVPQSASAGSDATETSP